MVQATRDAISAGREAAATADANGASGHQRVRAEPTVQPAAGIRPGSCR
jgi:hypothetical protein